MGGGVDYRKVPCWYFSADYEVLYISPVPATAENKYVLDDSAKSKACRRIVGENVSGWEAVKRDGSWSVYCMGRRE